MNESPITEMISLRPEVFSYALGLTKCPAKAEDLTQDVMTKALVSIRKGKYENQSLMKGWLCRIAYTTFLNGVRRDQVQRKIIQRLGNLCSTSYDDNPGEMIEVQELLGALEEAFHLEKHFQIMVMSLLLEYEYKDIAKRMGIPLGTVMSSTHRARKVAQDYIISEWKRDRMPLGSVITRKILDILEDSSENTQ